jgi:hypothetical protein
MDSRTHQPLEAIVKGHCPVKQQQGGGTKKMIDMNTATLSAVQIDVAKRFDSMDNTIDNKQPSTKVRMMRSGNAARMDQEETEPESQKEADQTSTGVTPMFEGLTLDDLATESWDIKSLKHSWRTLKATKAQQGLEWSDASMTPAFLTIYYLQ